MGMLRMMFALQYHSPDEQGMKDIRLTNGLAGTFGSVAALLAPFTDHLIHSAIDALARMGDMEVKDQDKVRSVKTTNKGEKEGCLR